MPLSLDAAPLPLDEVLAGAFEPLGWTAFQTPPYELTPFPLTWPGFVSAVQVSTRRPQRPAVVGTGCAVAPPRPQLPRSGTPLRSCCQVVQASCAPRTRSGWRAGAWRGRLYCSGSGRPPPLTLPLAPFCTSGRSGPSKNWPSYPAAGRNDHRSNSPIPGSGRRSSAGLYRSPRSSVGACFAVARSPTRAWRCRDPQTR